MYKRKTNIDLVSGLPDEILCHILSFLTTKFYVRTSVLSKRWRFLWAHVPNLLFHERDFSSETTQPAPLDIISRVSMLHQAKFLNTFQLSICMEYCPSYRLDTLIIYLLTNRTLRKLSLFLRYKCEDDLMCALPTRLIFTCKTLVDLELVNCGIIPSSGELFLPSLKKLNLRYADYESDKSLPHLLSGCPVLEELIVEVCFRERQKNSGCVIVSSPTIKTLNVDFYELGEDEFPDDEMLIMDVPALEYLKVDHCDLDSLKSLESRMTNLIEAEITLNGRSHTRGTDHARSIEFLSCLSRARFLRISSDFAESLVNVIGPAGSMPKFVNLTKLQLKLTVDWYKVVEFLEVADNLEVLIVSLYEMPPYTEPKRVPPCMLSRLRNVTLNCFGACDHAFDLVRYVLMNAQVLKKMEIYAEDDSSDKDNFDALQKISLFERGSTSCQLDFNNAD